MKDVIYSINGPVVTVKDTSTFGMAEMVYVGNAGLIGEVISVSEARTTIQVYENTTGLLVGEPVKGTGAPLSATLGPGIMENIFDGIERPLTDIAQKKRRVHRHGRPCGQPGYGPQVGCDRHRQARRQRFGRHRRRNLPGDQHHHPQKHGAPGYFRRRYLGR